MNNKKDIEWFKEQMVAELSGYEFEFRFFERGDFGPLNQVEFNSEKIGGNIDFWGLGWLGVFVWSYEKEEQMLNILLEPHNEEEKEKVFDELKGLLK
ncbi:hypothetical protein [Pedobacter deserti]|uniref:hypothetical protein n=1 Tax=Pedobacter deserti TaxID=2817382 RepID=UPI00210899DA|nr:hypothetical protein [Pedobacter sp. SYSU D00382]